MSTEPQIEKTVSLRAFAAMVGKSEGGVRKAIGNGNIKDGFVNGKILPSIASAEWGKPILEAEQKPSEPEAPVLITPNSGELEIEAGADIAAYEDTAYLREVPVGQFDEFTLPAEEVDDSGVLASDDDIKFKDQFLKDIPQGTTKIEAERLYSVFRARKMKRELQKLEGELVDKGLVYQNLFEFSAMIRDNFLNIPDRCVDNIRAADTRNEALLILTEEINATLKALLSIGDIKISKEN